MKKIAIVLSILMVVALSGCGATTDSRYGDVKNYFENTAEMQEQFSAGAREGGMEFMDEVPQELPMQAQENLASDRAIDESLTRTSIQMDEVNRKIIKNVDISMETKEFDNLVSEITKIVSESGGYIESSNISTPKNGQDSKRYLNMAARIPSEKLNETIDNVTTLGSVESIREESEDITIAYADTDSRKKALEIEQKRLLELMEKAENIEDIIKIEERLSNVRYQLDMLGGALKNYDNLVDYSTFRINVSEVEVETKSETITDRISTGFAQAWNGLLKGFENTIVWFVSNIPYIVIYGIFITAVVLIALLQVKKHKKKMLLQNSVNKKNDDPSPPNTLDI